MEKLMINGSRIRQAKNERKSGMKAIAVTPVKPPFNNRIDNIRSAYSKAREEIAITKE